VHACGWEGFSGRGRFQSHLSHLSHMIGSVGRGFVQKRVWVNRRPVVDAKTVLAMLPRHLAHQFWVEGLEREGSEALGAWYTLVHCSGVGLLLPLVQEPRRHDAGAVVVVFVKLQRLELLVRSYDAGRGCCGAVCVHLLRWGSSRVGH
jgi:hypothetical protein